MSARDEALAEAVEQLLAGIADVSGFCSRLEVAGGCGRLLGAINARLVTTPTTAAGAPLRAVWSEATERLISRP